MPPLVEARSNYYILLATRGRQPPFLKYNASQKVTFLKSLTLTEAAESFQAKNKQSAVLTALSWSPVARTPVGFPGCGWAESGRLPHTAAAELCLQRSEWPGRDQPAAPRVCLRRANSSGSVFNFRSEVRVPSLLLTHQRTVKNQNDSDII